MLYGGAAVAWLSRTQRCVTASSSEAKHVSIGDITREIMFVRQVLEYLRPDERFPAVTVYEDNDGAIQLAQNPLSSGRTKHIDVRHHFIRDLVKEGKMAIKHVESAKQRADCLTKALGGEPFMEHRNVVMSVG